MAGRRDLDVEGRRITISNVDKVLWPATGMTKGEMIRYYVDVAPVLLPHIEGRPITLHRFPDGVDGVHWFQTRALQAPEWVTTQPMHVFTSGKDVRAVVIDGLAALVWAANAAAIELHPYLARADRLAEPDAVVFDLDPGPPADLADCCRVALELRELLDSLSLSSVVKVSGGKGLHVYVPVAGDHGYDATKAFARALAGVLTTRAPDRVTDVMARGKRAGKVFVDWSQNDAGKSTVAPYSLRGLPFPTVSMPVTWDEVAAAAHTRRIEPLVFLAGDVPTRLATHGDLFRPALEPRQHLP